MKNKFWEFKNIVSGVSADLYIYNEISSWDDEDVTSAKAFKQELDNIGEVQNVNLYINSVGGSVSDGLCIASMIKRNSAKFTGIVDGMACSIASVILDSCDVVKMYSNTMQMIHNASVGGFFFGNASDFRKQAEDLDKITASLRQTYLDKAGDKLTEEKLIELMNNESWLSAQECYDLGLCDEILQSNKMVAKIDKKFANIYSNVPDYLLNEANEEVDNVAKTKKVIKDEVVVDESTQDTILEDTKVIVVDETHKEVVDNTTVENEVVEEETVVENTIDETENDKEVIVEDKDAKISELTAKVEDYTNKILTLNEKISDMQKIVELYNAIQEEKSVQDKQNKINEKKSEFKNRFEKLGARDKFESEEVQALINKCVDDKDAMISLSEMLVNLVDVMSIENKPVDRVELPSTVENLIPECDSITVKYGFK